MRAIIACHKPVIVAVNGIATAAGCQLVASCDLAIAGESAQFATPGVNAPKEAGAPSASESVAGTDPPTVPGVFDREYTSASP